MPTEPQSFAVCSAKVDSQHRVLFPASIRKTTRFLSISASVIGYLRLGRHGQLIAFADESIAPLLQSVGQAVVNSAPSIDEVNEQGFEAVRSLSLLCPVTFNFEQATGSFRMTLPKMLRDLQVCPSADSSVVLFASPTFIELWGSTAYLHYFQSGAGLRLESAKEALKERWGLE